MATATGNYVQDNSSLTNFKSWAQAISNALAAFGWVQTTDTGQVNWSTIAAVPASTYVYEIWKAGDALAATMPIFLKIEYGFSTTIPRIRITVGTGSSGAGVINGVVQSSTPQQITNDIANSGSTTYPCYFSGNSAEFRMSMWSNPSGAPQTGVVFGIERSKDGTGANTNEYITVLGVNQSSAGQCYQQTIKATGSGNRENGVIAPALSNGSGTGSAFGTVAALPVFPILGKVGNPMLGFMTATLNDVGINSTVTVNSVYGSAHTYVVAGGGNISSGIGQKTVNSTNMALLMRYE